MAAESAKSFQALEAQAQVLMGTFTKAGYEAVAPAMIQPAEVFLDVVGEALRARTYVFSDPDGAELCLRPDITVPACRLYLERHPKADQKARYCYNGPIFRFQPAGADQAHPREFRQAGIESFNAIDREKADAEILGHTLQAMTAAGLKAHAIRIGDIAIFHEMMAKLDMPDLWRRRLRNRFWRPDSFRAELKRLSTDPGAIARALPEALLKELEPSDPDASEAAVARHLEREKIDVVGLRSVAEITQRLLNAVHDQRCEPLAERTTKLIASYLAIAAPARAAAARLRDLAGDKDIDIAEALDAFQRRLGQMQAIGIDPANVHFSAEFGRNIEYYTGFVFEVSEATLGAMTSVAGGGRYDTLLSTIGAPKPVAAVGSSIHTERLLQIVNGGAP